MNDSGEQEGWPHMYERVGRPIFLPAIIILADRTSYMVSQVIRLTHFFCFPAVFMLIVAVRFYQQSSSSPSMINEEWFEMEAQEDSKGGQGMGQKEGGLSQAEVLKEKEKEKKGS